MPFIAALYGYCSFGRKLFVRHKLYVLDANRRHQFFSLIPKHIWRAPMGISYSFTNCNAYNVSADCYSKQGEKI